MFLPRGIGQFVASQCRHIHTDVTEQIECVLETVACVAFGEQLDDVDVALITQRLFDFIANADHPAAVLLGKVAVLQLCVQLDEGGSDPAIELHGVGRHRPSRAAHCGHDCPIKTASSTELQRWKESLNAGPRQSKRA